MRKIFLALLTLFLAGWFIPVRPALAQGEKSAVIVNPIRGKDFWSYNYSILDTPQKQYAVISQNHLPATWLVRFDALTDPKVVQFLKSLNPQQEIGLFLEVTPTLTQAAGVKYNQSANWHFASSILLTGYSPSDREKLIDTAVGKYKEIFGATPKSVGSWWIDAYSLDYLRDKYGIEANLDVADQYSTDQYQVWGQYWSTPFYPSKKNALVPAQSPENKIGVVTIQWATRDPYNGYGHGDFDSTYSVQPNDYMLHDLDSRYFAKLLDIYPQTTVGLENDFSWDKYGSEYQKQFQILSQKQQQGGLNVYSMAGFAQNYQAVNPGISPSVLISTDDPLGSGGKVVWFQTPKFRVGWFFGPDGSVIKDYRLFNDSVEESCFKTACPSLQLSYTAQQAIDEVNYSTKWVLDEGKISNFKSELTGDSAQISYTTQTGTNRVIKFLPNDIEINGKIQTISQAILTATTVQQVNQKIGGKFVSGFPDLAALPFETVKFLLFTLLFFFLPGWSLSRSKIAAIPLGWAIFTLAGFVFSYLKVNALLWAIPLLSLLGIRSVPKFIPPVPSFNGKNISLALTIGLGSLSWLLTTVKNGLLYPYGFGYWGPNGHDAIWHLALISQLKNNLPPADPVFAGENLSNYHYFFDLLLAKTSLLFAFSDQDLLFRFFPLLLAPLGGVLMFLVTKKLSGKFTAGLFATFFLYFGGSFGWILSFLRDRSLGGESTFWAQQGISTLLNPPFAISLVLLLAGLYFFTDFLKAKKLDLLLLLTITLLWGSLIEFKAYAGVLVLGGLGILSLEYLLRKKDFRPLFLLLGSGLLSLTVFLPNNSGASSLFVFKPLWFIKSMIEMPDRLNWVRFANTLQSGNQFKISAVYFLGTAAFLIGNLGWRFIGLFSLLRLGQQRFLFYLGSLAIALPLLFIQTGTNWNTIQFFYYGIFVFNILAGITLSFVWEKLSPKIAWPLVGVVLLLTLPTTFDTLGQYLPSRPPTALSAPEYQALNFLKQQPAGTVLTYPFDQYAKDKYWEPVPLYAYASTGYVAAFSGHPSFVDDTINLDILGLDYKGRLNDQKNIFKNRDEAKELLQKDNIKYIYLPKNINYQEDDGLMGIEKIFENSQVKIFKVL